MPLKIKLKPSERVLIAGALITNGDAPTQLFIENKVPLLRQKDIMIETDAETICQKIYFIIQLMYFTPDNLKQLHSQYWELVRELINASPSAIDLVSQISEQILVEKYYAALKVTKKLLEYEKDLISHAQKSS